MSETLLKSALEKIVFFECRIDQLTADLKRAEEELTRLRREAQEAAVREAKLRESLAAAAVHQSEAVRQRDAARRRSELLSAERERFLGRLIEIEQIRKAGGDDDGDDGVDLAAFIAELRAEVMRLTAENQALRSALPQTLPAPEASKAPALPVPSPSDTGAPEPASETTLMDADAGGSSPPAPAPAPLTAPASGTQMALPLLSAHRGERPLHEMTAVFRTPGEAAESLKKSGRLGLSDADRDLLQASMERSADTARDRPFIGRDMDDLQSSDAPTRRRAAERLRSSAPAESLPMLAAALNAESDDEAAKALIAAIAETGSTHGLPLILPSLTSRSLAIRLAALEAAVRLGGRDCVLKALDDPSPLVRRRAVVLASASGDRRAVLARALRDGDVSVRKLAALDAGASADDPSLAEVLTDALDDPEAAVREAAAKSLAAAAGPEVLQVVRLGPSIRRREVRRIVAALHPASEPAGTASAMASGAIDRRLGSIQRTLTAIAQGRTSAAPNPAPAPPPAEPPPPAREAASENEKKEASAARAAASEAAETTAADAQPPAAEDPNGDALAGAIVSRVYGALRGQTTEGLAKALRLSTDTIRTAVEKLVQEGRIVRRGSRYFVP